MKLVLSVQGTASVKVSQDDVLPVQGLSQHEFTQFVGNLYGFEIRPNIPPNFPQQMVPPLWSFANGRFIDDNGDAYQILNLMAFQNGDAITAANTEYADLILNHYIEAIDSGLKFRYSTAKQERFYVSNIVVEFSVAIEQQISGIARILDILNKQIPRPHMPFSAKRMAFGAGDPVNISFTTADAVARADFTIERRASEPYSSNRYFSSGPVRTADHIRILEMIEDAIKDGAA